MKIVLPLIPAVAMHPVRIYHKFEAFIRALESINQL